LPLLRGVTRSKRRAMRWRRKAADAGDKDACLDLALCMYADSPYAREIGHLGEADGVATSAEVMEGHDVPPDVLAVVVHWLRKGTKQQDIQKGTDDALCEFRIRAREGVKYCYNDGCEAVGHLKDFKVCPQCKTARYCGAECQKHDWTTGGHKATCGTSASKVMKL
jgi:TPR repeat protein